LTPGTGKEKDERVGSEAEDEAVEGCEEKDGLGRM
jgi:hypothetical protein